MPRQPNPIPGPAEILDNAADAIETNGLHHGGFYNWRQSMKTGLLNCAVCAVGAIKIGAGGSPDDDVTDAAVEASVHLAQHLGLAHDYETVILNIGAWNDNPDRTAEQVITELRACAADLRAAVAS